MIQLTKMRAAARGWVVETEQSETTLYVTATHPDHGEDHGKGQGDVISVLRRVLAIAGLTCPTSRITHSGGSATARCFSGIAPVETL